MERSRDKVLLEQALARERAVEEFETAERNARRREIVELQQHYNKVQSDKAAYERHIDELTQQENEKQWNARESQWRREDQARVNLLKNVYQNREADILLKQKLKEEAAWLKNNEKQLIESEVEAMSRAHEQ